MQGTKFRFALQGILALCCLKICLVFFLNVTKILWKFTLKLFTVLILKKIINSNLIKNISNSCFN